MSTDDLPQARRLRRPTWRDPRLGVGLLLVGGSVALGTWAVRDAAATVEVYAAADALTPGDVVTGDDLLVREVRLGDDEDLYHLVADGLPERAVAVRTVGPGELVPRAALGGPDAVEVQPVVVDLGLSVPAGLEPGATVDLWLAPAAPVGGAAPSAEPPPDPELLVGGLVVAEILQEDSVIAGADGTSIEVLVPRRDVSTVLAALSGDGRLVAVPTMADTDRPAGGEPEETPDESPTASET
ncbi:hypothetical protein [Georgenia alba]|uniref:SAF domain-containing protein n=1 Tax=Georgenia alba TaxID=2233858 RepID=A0ABW2QC59_9MICO